MNRYDNKLASMNWDTRIGSTVRAALAVVDAANKGVLSPTVTKRVYEYINTPYAYFYGEKEISLADRFLIGELRTKTAVLNVLGLLEISGGYVNKSLYGGFTPKGVKYGHIQVKNAFYIINNADQYYEILANQSGIVAPSDDYSYEEHECYARVAGE